MFFILTGDGRGHPDRSMFTRVSLVPTTSGVGEQWQANLFGLCRGGDDERQQVEKRERPPLEVGELWHGGHDEADISR